MAKRFRQLILVFLAVAVGVTPLFVVGVVSASPTVTEYLISDNSGGGPGRQPFDITAGPDGALWFTEYYGRSIGRITTSGAITSWATPSTSGWYQYPRGITTGPDGALWFTQFGAIGRITTAGVISEYYTPTYANYLEDITTGSDGALWFTEWQDGRIGRITTSGAITEFTLPSFASYPNRITTGSDGALWFTAGSANGGDSYIFRMTTTGSVTSYPIPTLHGGPQTITTGSDGALWFTEAIGKIGRMTVTGSVTEMQIPTANAGPQGITTGPDGTLWFVEEAANKIGSVSLAGNFSEYNVTTSSAGPINITTGPDGALWFTEWTGNRIGRLVPDTIPQTPLNLAAFSPTNTSPSLSWSASSGATSYNIYRNGTKMDSTTSTTYTDSTAPEGTDTYYVTAVNGSGESAPSNSVDVVVDRAAPTVTGTPDSQPNSSGWHNQDVTVNWTSTDPSPSSGTPTQPTATLASTEGDITYTSDQSCDPANNCATGSLELKIDKTAPTISYTVTPTPNFANWNKTDAVVTFTCNDTVSGIDSCTAPITIATDGGNQTVTGTAVDKAGNTATTTATINLDKTAPTITSSLSPVTNANGWNNTPVTVSYTCTDVTSGIASCSSPQTESADGSYTLTGAASDNAGNSSTTTTQVNLDQTAPDITYTVSPSLNSNGWTTSSTATVTFICNDALSGIDSCTAPVTLTGDGAYVVTGTAVDRAGNITSINALVGIDTSQPTITATISPAPNSSGWNNTGPVTVAYNCSDTTSGIASCPAPQTESADGQYTLSGTAVDNAGNIADILTQVNIDTTAPVVTNLSWSANPLMQGQDTTLSASVTDNLSGTTAVYYTLDGGTSQAMTYDTASNTWKATFGSTLASNTYTINVYATDTAGNTSASYMDVLTVSSNSVVSGHARLVPGSGDTLPIALDTATHNPTELVLGFSGNNNGPNSIEAHYVVKNNKDEFGFSSTAVDWVVVPDGAHASILVHGTMTTYVNGTETITNNVAMLVDVTLGTNGGADQVTVSLWLPGQDPSTTLPSYRVSEPDLANKSTVTIQ